MTNITLRSVKGSPLTNNEVDSNFNSLNVYKVELTDSTGSIIVPTGTTAERDVSPLNGYFRYNTDDNKFEGYVNNQWSNIGELTSSISYNTSNGVLTLTTSDSSYSTIIDLQPFSTTDLVEGTNLYYTTSRADSDAKNAVSVVDLGGDGSLTYNPGTGIFTYTGPSATEVRAHFNGGTGITYTSATGTFATNDGQIVHDNLSGFVANEHVDHSTVSIVAGAGLTGGGDITASRTLNIGAGTGITVNADDIAIGQDVATTANVTFNSLTTTDGLIVGGNLQVNGTTTTVNTQNLSIADNMFYLNQLESAGSPTIIADVGWAANINDDGVYTHAGMFRDATDNTFKVFNEYAPEPDSALEINTGDASFKLAPFAALTYTGKYLGADSDIDAHLVGGTGITYSSGTISTNDGQIIHDNLSGFVANEHIDHSTVSITAGTGLTGGGDITTSRTLSIANTGVAAATYGDSSTIPRITVNAQGQITAVVGASVNIPAGYDKTNFDSDFGTKTTTDLTEGTNLYYTDTRARDALSGGTGITYTAASGTIATNDGQIVHDNLSGFVANEHIDHSGVNVTAGAGLTGGGDITASRTLNVGAGSYIIVNADDVAVDATTTNTASKVVARDASGNFSAGTITAALSGNASTATALQTARTIGGVSFDGTANINLPGVNTTGNQNTTGNAASATFASAVTLTADNSTNATNYPLFANAATGNLSPRTDTGLTYNPSTGVLTSTTFSGALSGNASTATILQTARLIGGVSFNGSTNINLPGVNTTGNQNTTGTAAGITGYTGTFWTSDNDGAASGLDADLLDGQQGSYYRINVYNSAGTLLN